MTRLSLPVFVLILLITSPANSQDEFIWVAGMKLKKGMTKNYVIPKLKENYKLANFGDKDSWAIVQEEGSKTKFVGQVAFRDDKLIWASRNWGFFSGHNAYDLSEALYGALSNVTEYGSDVAQITTSSQRAPGISSESITITFPQKIITVSVSRGDEVEDGVSIQESFHHIQK